MNEMVKKVIAIILVIIVFFVGYGLIFSNGYVYDFEQTMIYNPESMEEDINMLVMVIVLVQE
jgi:hypothetical protein